MNKNIKLFGVLAAVLALTSCGTPASSSETSSQPGSSSEVPSSEVPSSEEPSSEVPSSSEEPSNTIPSDDPYLPGKQIRRNYNALASTDITDGLNYLTLSSGDSASHFANFVDPLVLHNEFGSLEKCLATSFTQDDNYSIFTIKIREGVKWLRYDGSHYEAMIDGELVPQYVSANDFVTTAKTVLTQANASNTYYMYTKFIEGSAAYYHLSFIDYEIAKGTPKYVALAKNPAKLCAELEKLIKADTGLDYEINPEDLNYIRSFEGVGVRVTEEPGEFGGGTIEYRLENPAFYFPTVLNYSCYLPVNQHFLNEVKIGQFGTQLDKLLYCGPFRLTTWTSNDIVYSKNQEYWNEEDVHVDTIHLTVYPSAIAGVDYARKEFEAGRIDGFSLSTEDEEGWIKYISGPDGTGTYLNPYSQYVNAREYNTIDYVYGLNINMDRTNDSDGKASKASEFGGNATDIANAEKALSLSAVRKLVIESFDLPSYCESFGLSEEIEQQYMMNTYTPKGFVQDDAGNDYVTTHYYDVYQEHNPELSDAEVEAKLAQGQYDEIFMFADASNDSLKDLRDAALAEINAWNATYPEDQITLPVQMEYFSVWGQEETKVFDAKLILEWNKRLNGMYDATGFTKLTSPYFYVIPTSDLNAQNYEAASNGGNFDLSSTWGWGPDYGDPMSYLNTFAKNGDWGSIFNFVAQEETLSYSLVDGELVEEDILAAYTEKVLEANAVYDNLNERYHLFAEAEYMLINELNIYRPLTMRGQGWNVSVSRAAGYHSPSGSYGLSSNRLQGLYVIDGEGITRAERQAAVAAYDALKAEYLAAHGAINVYD